MLYNHDHDCAPFPCKATLHALPDKEPLSTRACSSGRERSPSPLQSSRAKVAAKSGIPISHCRTSALWASSILGGVANAGREMHSRVERRARPPDSSTSSFSWTRRRSPVRLGVARREPIKLYVRTAVPMYTKFLCTPTVHLPAYIPASASGTDSRPRYLFTSCHDPRYVPRYIQYFSCIRYQYCLLENM